MSKAVSPLIKFRAYNLLDRAVEEGLEAGWNKARKHTDDPSEETILEAQRSEIMLKLDEIINFGEDDL